MAKINFRSKDRTLKKLDKKLEVLDKTISSFESKMEHLESRINKLIDSIEANGSMKTERLPQIRAKTEHFPEQTEQFERTLRNGLRSDSLNRITGRHREILAMLINNGFHTYKQIAERLNISQSRARAYIAELKNKYGVPLRHVRDPEGYKVGIDVRFVEEVLLSK
jgi:DNA-binding CsgD family transcriptional regulator